MKTKPRSNEVFEILNALRRIGLNDRRVSQITGIPGSTLNMCKNRKRGIEQGRLDMLKRLLPE